MNKKVRIKEKLFKNGIIRFIPQFRLCYIWFDFSTYFHIGGYKYFYTKKECNNFLDKYLVQIKYIMP